MSQTQEFIAAVIRNFPEFPESVQQSLIEDQRSLRELLLQMERTFTVVKVDGTAPLDYPEDVKEALRPDLAEGCSSESYPHMLEQWVHGGQKKEKPVAGQVVYNCLEAKDVLHLCLGLRDLVGMAKKGRAYLKGYFRNQMIVGWKSVARDTKGHLKVPVLCVLESDYWIHWRDLENAFDERYVTFGLIIPPVE